MSSSKPLRFHGRVRGADTHGDSLSFEGTSGRIFRTLPVAKFSAEALTALAAAMTTPVDSRSPETGNDSEENQGINAGHSYLGRFIDHHPTFDPLSSLIKHGDPQALTDFRTPRFGLDNLRTRASVLALNQPLVKA